MTSALFLHQMLLLVEAARSMAHYWANLGKNHALNSNIRANCTRELGKPLDVLKNQSVCRALPPPEDCLSTVSSTRKGETGNDKEIVKWARGQRRGKDLPPPPPKKSRVPRKPREHRRFRPTVPPADCRPFEALGNGVRFMMCAPVHCGGHLVRASELLILLECLFWY